MLTVSAPHCEQWAHHHKQAEKVRGTVHLAIGDNAHMGGTVSADLHEDFVLPHPDLYLDGEVVMRGGQLVGSRSVK